PAAIPIVWPRAIIILSDLRRMPGQSKRCGESDLPTEFLLRTEISVVIPGTEGKPQSKSIADAGYWISPRLSAFRRRFRPATKTHCTGTSTALPETARARGGSRITWPPHCGSIAPLGG